MNLLRNIRQIRDLGVKVGAQPVYFVYAAALSLLAAVFEGLSVTALIPMVQGAMTMNFDSLKGSHFVGAVFALLPSSFTASGKSVFFLLLSVIFTASVAKNILEYYSGLLVSFQVRKACNGFMKLVFSRYLSFGKQFFDQANAGYLQTVLLGFTAQVVGPFRDIRTMLAQCFMVLVYILLMFKISWKLAVITVIFLPLLYYLLNWLINRIKNISLAQAKLYNQISGEISNILSCIPLVKLYRSEEKEKKRFGLLSDHLERVSSGMDRKQSMTRPLQEIVILMAILALVPAMLFMFVKSGSSSMGGILVFFYLIKKLLGSFALLNESRASFATIGGLLSGILAMLDDRDKFFVPEGVKEFPGLASSIEFRDLSFAYIKDTPVLRGASFTIEKGKTTAIVGPTGTGKTTIISLLLRFYDSNPSTLLVDGTDIRGFNFKSLRSHMALVSQDTLLFNDTIRNNVIYGLEEEPSDEEIAEAVSKARLSDFILTLHAGLDTHIGDRGVKLSGGEKQRISIARALLKGSEILILDEATSSLDTKTERLIQEAINEVIKDKTAIVVAHRLSTIKNADKIVVIEGGAVVEQGKLDELLERKGKFYEYWQEQKFF